MNLGTFAGIGKKSGAASGGASSAVPIGAVGEFVIPPDSSWLEANGQIVRIDTAPVLAEGLGRIPDISTGSGTVSAVTLPSSVNAAAAANASLIGNTYIVAHYQESNGRVRVAFQGVGGFGERTDLGNINVVNQIVSCGANGAASVMVPLVFTVNATPTSGNLTFEASLTGSGPVGGQSVSWFSLQPSWPWGSNTLFSWNSPQLMQWPISPTNQRVCVPFRVGPQTCIVAPFVNSQLFQSFVWRADQAANTTNWRLAVVDGSELHASNPSTGAFHQTPVRGAVGPTFASSANLQVSAASSAFGIANFIRFKRTDEWVYSFLRWDATEPVQAAQTIRAIGVVNDRFVVADESGRVRTFTEAQILGIATTPTVGINTIGTTATPTNAANVSTFVTGTGSSANAIVGVVPGTTNIIRSADQGTTWTTPSVGVAIQDAVFGSGDTMVAVGAAGAIRSSADAGATWTARASGTSTTLESVAFASGVFVAAGHAWLSFRESTDGGVTWTTPSVEPSVAALLSSTTINNIWVASSGPNLLAYVYIGGQSLPITLRRDGGVWRRVFVRENVFVPSVPIGSQRIWRVQEPTNSWLFHAGSSNLSPDGVDWGWTPNLAGGGIVPGFGDFLLTRYEANGVGTFVYRASTGRLPSRTLNGWAWTSATSVGAVYLLGQTHVAYTDQFIFAAVSITSGSAAVPPTQLILRAPYNDPTNWVPVLSMSSITTVSNMAETQLDGTTPFVRGQFAAMHATPAGVVAVCVGTPGNASTSGRGTWYTSVNNGDTWEGGRVTGMSGRPFLFSTVAATANNPIMWVDASQGLDSSTTLGGTARSTRLSLYSYDTAESFRLPDLTTFTVDGVNAIRPYIKAR